VKYYGQGVRAVAIATVSAATVGLAACGGGSGAAAASASSNVLKLSSAVQSEHVARYAGAFGLIGGPGVGAIYSAVAQEFVTQSAARAANVACSGGGTYTVNVPGADSTITAGESASVTFDDCVGEIEAPGVSAHDAVSGSMTVQVQSVQGAVGSPGANWSYTALASANNLTLASSNGTTTLNGSVTCTTSYDASTGITTTTARAPTITIARTLPASSITGTITIGSLAFTRAQNALAQTDTLAASASVGIAASDVTMSFGVSTPTPITLTNGALTGGTLALTGDDATETVVVQSDSTLAVSVTSGSKTGSYMEQVADFEALLGS
jgi:hypothetical protein